MEETLKSLLGLWLVIAGLAYVVGGSKAAKTVMASPAKWVGGLALDLVKGIAALAGDLVASGLRGFGRWLDGFVRRRLGQPPRPPPLPPRPGPRRRP